MSPISFACNSTIPTRSRIAWSGANVMPAFGFQLQTLRVRLDGVDLFDQGLSVDQVLLFGRRLDLQHRGSHVAAMTAYRVRRHVERCATPFFMAPRWSCPSRLTS